LRSIATEASGEPVLFSWFEFLRDEALEAVGVVASGDRLPQLVLGGPPVGGVGGAGAGGGGDDGDDSEPRRTISASHVVAEAADRVRVHDERERGRVFAETFHECGVCMSEKAGACVFTLRVLSQN
jgi:hypothetical protein